MKYIFKPFWIVIVIIFTLFEICYLGFFNICSVLWYFNFKHPFTWKEWTKENVYFDRPGYDKNPIQTIIRRLTDSDDYKNR